MNYETEETEDVDQEAEVRTYREAPADEELALHADPHQLEALKKRVHDVIRAHNQKMPQHLVDENPVKVVDEVLSHSDVCQALLTGDQEAQDQACKLIVELYERRQTEAANS